MRNTPPRESHPADRRRLPQVNDAACLGAGRDAILAANAADMRAARALAEIERERAYVADACSSAVHWAVMNGLDSGRAHSLLRLGRLLHAVEESGPLVESGALTPQTAAVVGGLVPGTPLFPPSEEPTPEETAAVADRARRYLERALEVSRRQLARDVLEEKERVAQGERVVPLRFFVKQRVRDEWRLVKKIASRRAGRPLTEGEAFESVTGDYLARHDDDGVSGRKSPRRRRMGPTGEQPDGRTVPAVVRRTVKRRACDHCEFPGCQNRTFLQLCHIVWKVDGGDREADNLVVLCTQHHAMLDGGLIRFLSRGPVGVRFVVVATGEIVEPAPARSGADVLPGLDTDVGGRRADASSEGEGVAERPPPWCTGRAPATWEVATSAGFT